MLMEFINITYRLTVYELQHYPNPVAPQSCITPILHNLNPALPQSGPTEILQQTKFYYCMRNIN